MDAYKLKDEYDKDNQWVKLLKGGFSGFTTFQQFALAAARAYAHVPPSKEGQLLLGDTKIRSDAELMLNFGISGDDAAVLDPATCATVMLAMGRKDPPNNLTVKDLEKYRAELNKVPGSPAKNEAPLFGPGSLLNNPHWSPILNDCFMLGGIHTNLLFVLALNVDERAAWSKFKPAAGKPGEDATPEGRARIARETWRGFIIANQRIIWDKDLKVPRVFMRELLGLRKFGYKPDFRAEQLAFVCADVPKADDATLAAYVEMLNQVKFHANDKATLVKAVAEFLFDDEAALNDLPA
jgi:hypothetical protein